MGQQVGGQRNAVEPPPPAARPPRIWTLAATIVLGTGLVCAVVLGVIFLALSPFVGKRAPPEVIAQIELRGNQKAAEAFRHLNGRLPTTLEEMRALSARPGGDPILVVVCDPWKNPYLYETKGAFEFTITCLGADGAPGGEGACEDIVVHGPPAKDSVPR